MVKRGSPLRGTLLKAARDTNSLKNPTCCTSPYNLLLLIIGVVDRDGACPHGHVEGIFVEQDNAARMVGDVEMVREGIVLEVLDCLHVTR